MIHSPDSPSLPDSLRQLYPFPLRSLRTQAGAPMSYVDEGQGDHAVLMLHGNPTWSFYYRDLIRELAPHRRCVAPDHIGMGLSAKPADYAYTLARRIDDMVALVDSLGLSKIDLVMHDWGGAIGFGLAVRRPQLVDRIVIMNTAAFVAGPIPARIALCRLPGLGPLLVRGVNGFAGPAAWMAMSRRALTRDEARGYLWPYDSWAHRVAVSAFVQDIPLQHSHPSWPVLREVEQGLGQFHDRRILLVWGGQDFCFNDHYYQAWRQRFPSAETMYLDDAGHYVLEDARSDVLPRVGQHLRPD